MPDQRLITAFGPSHVAAIIADPNPFHTAAAAGILLKLDPARFEAATSQLARVRGRFRLVARSEGPLYPHTGIFSLAVSLEPR